MADPLYLTETHKKKKQHKGYGDTKLNVELQDGAGGENTKANAFFRVGKKGKRHCNSVQKSEAEYTS